jgi:hypothetical protein
MNGPRVLTMPARIGAQKVTSDATFREDAKATIRARYPDYAGDTVQDFITALLARVSPTDLLGSIEFGVAAHGTGRLSLEWEDGAVHVKERTSHAS